jgi:integrase
LRDWTDVLVKLKHLRVERDGRIYVRRNNRSIRLKGAPGTEPFYAEYALALEATARPREGPQRVLAGSLSWLCQQYFASAEFKVLAQSTRRVRRRVLEALCQDQGTKPYALLAERHVRKLRDAKADMPEAANTLLKTVRGLFAWAVEARLSAINPAKSVPKVRYKSDGIHTWTLEEVGQYEAYWTEGTKQRFALSLLLYTGARRSDVVRLGRQMARDGWLTFKAIKNGATISLPILPELQAEIDRAPRENLTFLVTDYGRPYTAAGFGMRFREWCNKAGLPHCTAHGLRKAGATIAAENGATDAQLNAIFGWADSSHEARRYTRAARQKVLASEATRLLSVPRMNPGTKIDEKPSKNSA